MKLATEYQEALSQLQLSVWDVVRQEFWIVFRLFFASVIGTWLIVSEIIAGIRANEDEASLGAPGLGTIPAE